MTRRAAPEATSAAPPRANTALIARTGTETAMPGVMSRNSCITMRAITFETMIPSGNPTTTAAAAIATARRLSRRRSGRPRAPSARMTAASRVRSTIRVVVVEPSRTSATSPATMPRNPIIVLTCSMSASIGWVPSTTVMGSDVVEMPRSASRPRSSSAVERSAPAESSAARTARRLAASPPISEAVASVENATDSPAHQLVNPTPTTKSSYCSPSGAVTLTTSPRFATPSVTST